MLIDSYLLQITRTKPFYGSICFSFNFSVLTISKNEVLYSYVMDYFLTEEKKHEHRLLVYAKVSVLAKELRFATVLSKILQRKNRHFHFSWNFEDSKIMK